MNIDLLLSMTSPPKKFIVTTFLTDYSAYNNVFDFDQLLSIKASIIELVDDYNKPFEIPISVLKKTIVDGMEISSGRFGSSDLSTIAFFTAHFMSVAHGTFFIIDRKDFEEKEKYIHEKEFSYKKEREYE